MVTKNRVVDRVARQDTCVRRLEKRSPRRGEVPCVGGTRGSEQAEQGLDMHISYIT